MNEPVLWMNKEGDFWHENVGHYTIPLYTHELNITDDEILDIWHEMRTETGGEIIDFVRAILKKAQDNG